MNRYCYALLASVLAAFLSPGQAATVPIPGLYNTGVDDLGVLLPAGQADTHYAFTNIDGTASGTGGHGVVTFNGSFPLGSHWLSNDSTSSWLSPSSDPAESYDPVQTGHYRWTLTFDLTGHDSQTASFSARFAADNTASVKLNGNLLATISAPFGYGFDHWTDFIASNGFQSGVNTLDFEVINFAQTTGNPTGLRVEFLDSQISSLTEEGPPLHTPVPPALILFISALPLFLFHFRGKRV